MCITAPVTRCSSDEVFNKIERTLPAPPLEELPDDDLPPVAAPIPATMPPEGRRQREYYQPQTIFTRCEIELDCIDCHNRTAHEIRSLNGGPAIVTLAGGRVFAVTAFDTDGSRITAAYRVMNPEKLRFVE